MEVKAVTKYVRLSPRKARDMARAIQGLPVADAIKTVEFSERKAARQLEKTIRSAVANAENNAKLSADDLRVKEATIGEGPAMKRFWARSRGMVSRIRKRTSHITIVLSDGK
ncbi:MAG: 50S ribosomal protein L22 [bacterium]|jgi:large subunit ribosomal protein L22